MPINLPLYICMFIFIFSIFSFSLLWGPYHHLKHLISVERLPFTVTYFGSMSATLYVAIFVSIPLVLISA